MAKPPEKLAQSLEVLQVLQQDGKIAIRSSDLTRTHRERLCQNGFLQEVIKGWYIPARPDQPAGESTAWYTAFWPFCAAYLQYLRGNDWCLSPEQSLSLHTENWTVPQQLLVRAIKARNKITALPYGTSLLEVRASMPEAKDIDIKQGLRLFSLPAALIACSPKCFRQHPTDMHAALAMIRDASEVLSKLLAGGHSNIAGRLAGGFRHIGRDRIADNIVKTMTAAGYTIRENNPFVLQTRIILPVREQSPYVNRIRLLWEAMRCPIIERFPQAPGLPADAAAYLKSVEAVYITDAYHSLSIEGYRVSPALIKRVRTGAWNPDHDKDDREQRNALAARGYWEAYQSVRKSLKEVLRGHNPGDAVKDAHGNWYRNMFAPGVVAGLLSATDLAGYRNEPVYIRHSMHVPPNQVAVRDAMPAFFDLLSKEKSASVRVVLGHFVFVYIHPYRDGNGRMGRFLMNVMLASGGYPWTIIPLEKRDIYMAALEEASVRQNIIPFCDFLAQLVEARLEGHVIPSLPE